MGYGNATYSADLKVIREVKYNILKCLCSNTYMKKNHFIMFEYMYLNITYNLKNVLVLFTVFSHLDKWFFLQSTLVLRLYMYLSLQHVAMVTL